MKFPLTAYTRASCLCQTTAESLQSPWRTAYQQQQRHQQQQVRSVSQIPTRSRYGRLREGTAAQASPYEVDVKMDEVKEALNACGTVQKTWQWALVNIWGIQSPPQRSAQTTTTERPSNCATLASSPPPYGIATAYYAPALHSLFLHFRDSLRSPHAALSVLEVTRARSAESLVLGSTPALYADVVKLHWTLRKDLAGVRDTVRAAKRIGILSSSSRGADSASSSTSSSGRYERGSSSSRGSSSNEDDVLRTQVEIALDEARREALTGSTTSAASTLDEEGGDDFLNQDFEEEEDYSSTRRPYEEKRKRTRTRKANLPWAQQHQLSLADEISTLLHSQGPA
ncbi:hypothetical protein CF326_g5150 [Tilletia indica]|nr:hypothetical protein CF326_g5150 [Tilletia indica]